MAGYEKYLVSREPKEMSLSVGGDEFKLKVRDIPRSKKNQIVSLAVKYDSDGNTHFDGDFYLRECLKFMIVEAPWGATDDRFLLQLKDVDEGVSNPLADALEILVPGAFKKNTDSSGADKILEIKKG